LTFIKKYILTINTDCKEKFQDKMKAGAKTIGQARSGTASPIDFAPGQFQRDQSGVSILRTADS
jgi:hypothetical protein